MDEFYRVMQTKYDTKRLGMPQRYLGWHIHNASDGIIALIQRLLIDQKLQDAGLLDANVKSTPYPSNIEYHGPPQDYIPAMDTINKYRRLIGELRYIADSTRPDIAYVVGRLGAALAGANERHWTILKATLHYLKIKRNYGLYFRASKQRDEICATSKTRPISSNYDADWVNDIVDRRSITGGFITINGHPISLIPNKQTAVALSTVEAEYRAMTEVLQQAIYTQTLALSFHPSCKPAIRLYNDNIPAITMIQALGATKRSKFIDLRHQYLKQQIRDSNTSIYHKPSLLLSADMFIKALERQRFQDMRDLVEVFEIHAIDQDLMNFSATEVSQGACERRCRETLPSPHTWTTDSALQYLEADTTAAHST